jgi:hypothetical protein
MIIDCGTCAVAGLACGDCVVSVLLGVTEWTERPAGEGDSWAGVSVTDVDDDHAAALEVLADSGLVPPLRLVPRSQAS